MMKLKLSVTVVGFLACLTEGAVGQTQNQGNPCNGLPGGTGLVNDNSGCDKYFSCVSYTPFEHRCPGNLHFDSTRNICDLPGRVLCQICPAAGILGVGVPNSCTAWVLCVNGRELPQECATGTHFNPTHGRCDLAENVPCHLDTCINLPGGIGLSPSTENCEDYFYCYNNAKLARGQCQPGLTFDIQTLRCVRAGNGSCYPGTETNARRFASADADSTSN